MVTTLGKRLHPNSPSYAGPSELTTARGGSHQKLSTKKTTGLFEKIRKRSAQIAVFGLGHVGLRLALSFSKKNFSVVGVDVDSELLRELGGTAKENGVRLTTDGVFATMISDFIVICVQTPIDAHGSPNLEFVKSAGETIRRGLSTNKCIILESTSYPGTTEEVLKPILETSGYRAGKDFYLGYSPERLNPGDKKWNIMNIPKIVAGIDSRSTKLCFALYSTICKKIIKAPNVKTAEAMKATENIFRFVNISLVNELSQVFSLMGVDTFDVIKLASTKPFGFLPHNPSSGVGGPCIPVTPLFMLHKAKEFGKPLDLLKLADKINHDMADLTVNVVCYLLKKGNTPIELGEVAILGMSYKRGMRDTRNSAFLSIYKELKRMGARIKCFDPYVRRVDDVGASSQPDLKHTITDADVILILTDHDIFRQPHFVNLVAKLSRGRVIVDGRGCLSPAICKRYNVTHLGLGRPLPRECLMLGSEGHLKASSIALHSEP